MLKINVISAFMLVILLAFNSSARAECKKLEEIMGEMQQLSLEELFSVEVVTESKFSQPIIDVPATVTVISAEDIKAYGYRTLADILRAVPGLHVSYERSYHHLGVRGLNFYDYNARVLVLLDGQRLNENMFDAAYIEGMLPVDLELVERVEFVAGPGSSVYGNNALLGVVNVITKKPTAEFNSEALAEAGSENTKRGLLQVNHCFTNGAEALAAVSVYQRDGAALFFPEYNTPEENYGVAENLDGEDISKFFGKFLFNKFSVQLAVSQREKGVPTAPYETVFNDPLAQVYDHALVFNVDYSDQWSKELTYTARLHLDAYDFHNDYHYLSEPAVLNHDKVVGRWWGGELKLRYTGLENHQIIGGIEFQEDTRQEYTNYDEMPSFVWYDQNGETERWAVYLLDGVDLLPNLLLDIGGRYDYYNASGILNDGSSEVSGDFSKANTVFSPRLAVVYKPYQLAALKLLYNTAFRAPNPTEIAYVIPPRVEIANLKQEEFENLETAIDYYWSTNLNVTTALFQNKFKDAIIIDPDDPLRIINGGNYLVQGGQIVIQWQSDKQQRLRASISSQRATDEQTGEWLQDAPHYLMKFDYTAPIFKGQWRAGLEAQRVGKRRGPADFLVAAYSLVNLTLSNPNLWKNVEFSASVYNLFDEDYESPSTESRYPILAIPQDGRSFRVSLKYRF